MKPMALLLFVFLNLNQLAFAGKNCDYYHQRIGAMDYYRQTSSNNDCFLSVHPNDIQDLIYRDFLFTATGELLVFNSFGAGDGPMYNGGRVYMFFPRTEQVDIQQLGSTVKIITAAPGLTFEFDIAKGIVTDFSWGDFKESANVDPKNKGGLELTNKNGLMLDVGFAMGHDPSETKTATATFKDHLGQACSVKNSQIFNYINDDVIFKFTDDQLKVFLNKTCPKLTLKY